MYMSVCALNRDKDIGTGEGKRRIENGEHEVHWSHAIRVLACLLALINRFIYREAMSAGPSLALSSISAYIHVHIISLLAVGRDRTMCESKWAGLCTEISADVGANLNVE